MKPILFAFTIISLCILSAGSQAQDPPVPPPAAESLSSDTSAMKTGTEIPPDPGYALLKVLARPSKDSIVLRWAPTTPHGWRIGNRFGYSIERGDPSGQTVLLTQQPVMPWEVEPWTDLLNADSMNTFIGIAVYALYGDTVLAGDTTGQDTVGANIERNTNLFGYALFAADNDPDVATALGLRFVDRSVKAGVRYSYTISLAGPQTYRIDAGTVDVVARTPAVGPPPKNVVAVGGDGSIQLRWEPNDEGEYSAYNVYRSENRGRTYDRLNPTPIAIVVPTNRDIPGLGILIDSTIFNYKRYRYQVRGIDAFGELGKPAEVEAMGRDLTPPPQPLVMNAEQVGRSSLRMRWEMIDPPGDLAGFAISRSEFPDSSFKRITRRLLPKTAREYTDEKANENEPYYVVAAFDTAGNVAPSFPLYGMLIDTIPPAIPKGLRGTVDSLGRVTLRWNRNRERNILGYRVLRANAQDHEFTQLTGAIWKDTVYVDSIAVNTLTRNVYYRIAAVNTRFGHSEMSPFIALSRRAIQLPTAPVFTDVNAGESSTNLRWATNSGDKLRSVILFRKTADADRWDTLATLSRSITSYTDRDVVLNMTYEYQIAVVDSNGMSVWAELPVQSRPYDSGVRPPVRDVKAILDQDAKGIRIEWAYDAQETDRVYFIIHRSVSDASFVQLRSVAGSARSYVDRELVGEGTYRYRIQVLTHGGAESPMSSPVSVQIAGQR